MRRAIFAALALSALMAAGARAAPQEDPDRQLAMAQRLQPFDAPGSDGWEQAFPYPFYRDAASGESDSVTMQLAPGAYMIVGLCNCASMDITLVGPGGTTIQPVRSNDQGAMYSLDVPAAGPYLVGIDMGDCVDKTCDIAVKAWRKKK